MQEFVSRLEFYLEFYGENHYILKQKTDKKYDPRIWDHFPPTEHYSSYCGCEDIRGVLRLGGSRIPAPHGGLTLSDHE